MVQAAAACALLAEFDGPARPCTCAGQALRPLRGTVAASTGDDAEMARWWRLRNTALSRTLGLAGGGAPGRPCPALPSSSRTLSGRRDPVRPGRGPARADRLAQGKVWAARDRMRAHRQQQPPHAPCRGGTGRRRRAHNARAAAHGAHRRVVLWARRSIGGTTSDEHGGGLARTWLVGRQYGASTMARFAALKNLLDPAGILDPGKAVLPPPLAPRPSHEGAETPLCPLSLPVPPRRRPTRAMQHRPAGRALTLPHFRPARTSTRRTGRSAAARPGMLLRGADR